MQINDAQGFRRRRRRVIGPVLRGFLTAAVLVWRRNDIFLGGITRRDSTRARVQSICDAAHKSSSARHCRAAELSTANNGAIQYLIIMMM